MPQKVTYKSLYTLVTEQIEDKVTYQTKSQFRQQLNRTTIAPFSISSSTNIDVSAQELVSAVQTILTEALPARILSGLNVTATTPASTSVNISAGKGTVGGFVYELTEDTTLPIPFDYNHRIFYVGLHLDTITIEPNQDDRKLILAKIIVPDLNVIPYVINTRDENTNDAYIVQFQEYKIYGDANGRFEEDTKELFKDNIGAILAETIVGTITLDENLKIQNVTGTLKLDSTSLSLSDFQGNLLSKFNQHGVYFYNNLGIELAKFTTDEARIGNILITTNSLQSNNFVSGYQGFRIKDNGNVEFNDMIIRGTIYALAGSIGGFTIASNKLYGGTIQTAATVSSGSTGVVMDTAGLRGYDSILGLTFSLPTDGSAPTFSSGIINSTVFEINTNSVLRTSETVGDGTANSYGILINNTGLYGCGANQALSSANLKALIDGTISLTGTIYATVGQIGSVTITSTGLSGGLITGSIIRGSVIESSDTSPRVRIDATGLYYQATTTVGKYGPSSSGNYGFKYGSGNKYGSGVSAYLFNTMLPILAVTQERNYADIRLFDRTADPVSGTHALGDLICVNGVIKRCLTAGSPGVFNAILTSNTTTGGTGSAGAGKQYITINVNGTNYKVLHDGTV